MQTDVNVPSKSNKQKFLFFVIIKSPLTKKAGSKSGSLRQWYGFADPDPYQNVTDPQHWQKYRTAELGNYVQGHIIKINRQKEYLHQV